MVNIKQLIRQQGIEFQIERNGQMLSRVYGLPNHESSTAKAYIGMPKDTDVSIGDWLINPENERFYVEDKVTDFAFGDVVQLKIFYQTESQYKQKSAHPNHLTFNIGTANNSVIGTQATVTMNINSSIQDAKNQITASNSNDKEELQRLISVLEMVVNNQVPAQKGLLSKFSAVMERNSWITGTISSILLNWLLSQAH